MHCPEVLHRVIFHRLILKLQCGSTASLLYYNKLKIRSGGNLFGISAGAHAGYSQNESDALASANEKKHRTMNITYNVGRAICSMSVN